VKAWYCERREHGWTGKSSIGFDNGREK